MTQEELLNQLRQSYQQSTDSFFKHVYFGDNQSYYEPNYSYQQTFTRPRPSQQASAKPVNKATRIKQVERELDILRGVIPTPKGYSIDKANARGLLKELRELQCA